jgi:putative phosphoribosyl transferase
MVWASLDRRGLWRHRDCVHVLLDSLYPTGVPMPHRFADRLTAGRELAHELRRYANRTDIRVLALPRGGVPVAYEIARALGAPLDVLVVRKLGTPGHEELAMGALASGGIVVREEGVLRAQHVSESALEEVTVRERVELERRERLYRGDLPPLELEDCTVILVDDGLATGATMRAAVAAVRAHQPRAIVVAVPVAQDAVAASLETMADDVVTLLRPSRLVAVGLWYADFTQTHDDEVQEMLRLGRYHAYD